MNQFKKKTSNLKVILSKVIMGTVLAINDKLLRNTAITRKLWLYLYIHESSLVEAEKI